MLRIPKQTSLLCLVYKNGILLSLVICVQTRICPYSGVGIAAILTDKEMKYGNERSNQICKEIPSVEALYTALCRILPDGRFPSAKQVDCVGQIGLGCSMAI